MKRSLMALAGLVLCGSLAAAQESTVEEQILVFANTATKTKLKAAIKMGMVKSNFTKALVEKEALNVIANRPYSSLSQLYNSTILGPESMEGIERRVRLNTPGGLVSPTLNLLNKKQTSANFLVKEVDVDAKAAVNIWTTRKAGRDHVLGTADDRWMPFKLVFGEGYTHHLKNQWHVHSLDEVEGVGPATIQKLADFAALNGY